MKLTLVQLQATVLPGGRIKPCSIYRCTRAYGLRVSSLLMLTVTERLGLGVAGDDVVAYKN